ncbi:MAG: polysaccharide biosynthesis C-terminal domain-containing protein [Clostridia bacterium]|nr:polysaccharide biosynthesis C-terminal domain-containing protein [Clostridia bacterium]
MNPYKKLFSNTAILGIGTFVSKLMVFFLMPLYTAVLSKSQYSLADILVQTSNFLIPFACVGITNGIFRFAAEKGEDKSKVLSTGLLIQFAMTGLFLIVSPLLGLAQLFQGYSWLIIIYVIAANYQALFAQYIRAKDKTALFAVQGIFNTVLTIGCNIVLLLTLDLGIKGYVLSTIIANLVTTVFIFVAGRLWKDIHLNVFSLSFAKTMLKYSAPLIPATVCWLVTDLSDRFFVAEMIGADVNGLYAAATKIPTILVLVSTVFNEAWQLSAIMESDDEEASKKMFSNIHRAYIAVCFIGCSVLILWCRWITMLLYNESYYLSWEFMPVLMLATVYANLSTFLGSVYTVKKKSLWTMWIAIIAAGINVVMNYFMIRAWGAMGAAISTLLSYFVVWIIRLPLIRKMLDFDLGIVPVAINSVFVIAQVVLIFLIPEGIWNWMAQFGLTLAVIAINAASAYRFFRPFIASKFGKNRSIEQDEHPE